MAKKEVTFDLLTEDGKNILTEDGKSFLIISRSWIDISIDGGGGGRHDNTDWFNIRRRQEYQRLEKEKTKYLRIIIKFGGRRWESVYTVYDDGVVIRLATKLKSMVSVLENVNVSASVIKYWNKTVKILARKK